MKLEGGAYMHTNGYFQLASTKDGLMITVYPPQPGGRKAEVEDLISYAAQKVYRII